MDDSKNETAESESAEQEKSPNISESEKSVSETQEVELIDDSDDEKADEKPSTSKDLTPELSKQASLGAELEAFNRTPFCFEAEIHDLKPGPSHTILIKASTITNSQPPQPYPGRFVDKWDQHHVRMPCSKKSEYPMTNAKGEEKVEKRWDMIEATLLGAEFNSSLDIEEAIMSYNRKQRWKFRGLHKFFTEEIGEEECKEILTNIVPAIAKLALRLPELCTAPVPLLKRGMNHSITMSQEQAACLLANAFFCTYPRRNSQNQNAEYANYPDINFSSLLNGSSSIMMEKLKCILHYFKRVTEKMPTGNLTFERKRVDVFPAWKESAKLFRKLHVSQKGTIEDFGQGLLQVDFANKFLGGGVLGHGCVQEEIRFLICPEMLVSKLVTEALADNESLTMTGCERFSYYSGYGNTFEWRAPFTDETPRDGWGRIECEVVAIDAIYFSRPLSQYFPRCVTRELNKAFVGFYEKDRKEENLSAIATGNWGCGAFNGDVQVKSIIQLMSAAEAERDVAYFTFDDKKLMTALYQIHSALVLHKVNVGEMSLWLESYYNTVIEGQKKVSKTFFNHIYSNLAKKSDSVSGSK